MLHAVTRSYLLTLMVDVRVSLIVEFSLECCRKFAARRIRVMKDNHRPERHLYVTQQHLKHGLVIVEA